MKVIVETCRVDIPDEGYCRNMSCGHIPDEGYCRNMSCGLIPDEGYCRNMSWTTYLMKVIVETCRVDYIPDERYCRNMSYTYL